MVRSLGGVWALLEGTARQHALVERSAAVIAKIRP
jgi:hypothetical protein